MRIVCRYFNKMLGMLNIHLDENQKWIGLWFFIFGLIATYITPSITKEIITNLPAEWIAFESLFVSISALLIGVIWKGKVREKAINSFISARKLHPLGWRGIAASLLLIKHYFFFLQIYNFY